jgi:DNA repair exonuclease SbcCD nuclease subunit
MKILLTDTHFGVRQNSILWLKSQMKFFYEQLIPFIKNQKEGVFIYHLGDLFDSRSSINPFIANQVRELFSHMASLDNVRQIIIIGGNHDYYSPNDSTTDSINLVLREINKVEIITNGIAMYEDEDGDLDELGFDVFVPWNDYYDFHCLESSISIKGVKRVFVHNDLDNIEPEYKNLFKKYNVDVYSGHIHTPSEYNKLHNLGSCFALTFSDANQQRGFYTMCDDGSDLKFHPNTKSIKFYRLHNKEIFNQIDFESNDYIELYIDQDKLSIDDYQNRIKWFNENYKNVTIVPRTTSIVNESNCNFQEYNIDDICKELIPDNLKEKFNIILEQN